MEDEKIKNRDFDNAYFYGVITFGFCIFLICFVAIGIFLPIINSSGEFQIQKLRIASIWMIMFIIILNYKINNFCRKFNKEIISKHLNETTRVKPIITKAKVFAKNIFQEKLETLNYKSWKR